MSIDTFNQKLAGASADEIIRWGLEQAGDRAIISTNFRPLEAVLLHMVVQQRPDMPVLWVDHGYNTPQTYRCAEAIIDQLGLNIHLYIPRRTVKHRDTVNGGIPDVDNLEAHGAFTEEVKLEPFRRGLAELAPSVWFTALRRETQYRQGLEVVSEFEPGLLRVSPVLNWSDDQMNEYLAAHGLPSEDVYFDPTKVVANRECGLHVMTENS